MTDERDDQEVVAAVSKTEELSEEDLKAVAGGSSPKLGNGIPLRLPSTPPASGPTMTPGQDPKGFDIPTTESN